MKKRTIILVASLVLTTIVVRGQSRRPPVSENPDEPSGMSLEVFANGNMGMSGANYTTSNTKLGGNFGVGAIYSFTENWGLTLGGELAFYNSGVSSRDVVSSIARDELLSTGLFPDYRAAYDGSAMVDGNSVGNFAYGTNLTGYSEDYSSIFLNVPLLVRYMNKLTITSQGTSAAGYAGRYQSNHKMYIAAGAKLAVPITAKVVSHVGSLTVDGMSWTGYSWGDLVTNQPDATALAKKLGFGDFTGDMNGASRSMKLNLGVAVSVEAGYSYPLPTDGWVLCGGVYFDYGLTNLYTRDRNVPANMIIVPREPTADNPQSPVINNQAMASQRLNNMAVGVILRLSMGITLGGDGGGGIAPKSIDFSAKVLGF